MTDSFFGESEWGRSFVCGWVPRREGVLRLAERLKAMAVALEGIQPGLGRLWPQFAARSLRPDDPGYLLDCPVEDLARLLDRRARSAPPQLPAPVGRDGYQVALASRREDAMSMSCGANIWVDSDRYALDEPVRLSIDHDSPIWRSAEMARRILLGLVDAWDAEWATAGTVIHLGLDEGGALIAQRQPWMAWVATGHEAPALRVRDAGAPLDVQAVRDGLMSTWAWPPELPQPPKPRLSE